VASAQSVSEGGDTGTRPNAGGKPDEILVRAVLLDIAEIDDRQQVFTADVFFEMGWQDARLVADDEEGNALRTVPLDEIWYPSLTIINNRGLDFLLPEVATIDRQGNVMIRQRIVGPLSVDLELRDFPFDKQRLPIEVVSYQYSDSEIAFAKSSEMAARLGDLSGSGWTYSMLEPAPFIYSIDDSGRGGSGIVFAVMAERESSYYIFTLALPMTLILFLAWMTHWLPVDIIPPRMGMASATVFSLIAFGVSFRLTLPKIAYLTDADRFVLYSTLLVIVSLAIAVTTARWATTDRKEAAARLSKRARLAFPFLYGLVVLLTITT
jgi:hypothetical protein